MITYLIRVMIIACVGLISLIGCSGEEDVSPEDENLEMFLEEETPKDLHGCAILEKPANFTDNALSEANAKFGFKLLTELYNQKPGTNIFISPLSVSIALTMTYNGARGETQRAMAKTLDKSRGWSCRRSTKLTHSYEKSPRVQILRLNLPLRNSIWLRDTFDETNPDFLDRNERFFGAEIASLDFDDPQTLETINQWVNTNTQGQN